MADERNNHQAEVTSYLQGPDLQRVIEKNLHKNVPRKYMLLGTKIAFDALKTARQIHSQMVAEVATVDPTAMFPMEVAPHVQDLLAARSIIIWCQKNARQLGGYDQVLVSLCAIRVSAMVALIREQGKEPWLSRWITALPTSPGQRIEFDLHQGLAVACGQCRLIKARDEQSGQEGFALDTNDLRRLLDLGPRIVIPEGVTKQ